MATTDEDIAVGVIHIDGAWDLRMVGDISNAFVQLYSAAYFLTGPAEPVSQTDLGPAYGRLHEAISPYASETEGRFNYPWRGGHSVNNFFRSVYSELPPQYRPQVLEIRYASPGFIEHLGYAPALLAVTLLTVTANRLLGVYQNVQKTIRDHQLNRLTVRERAAKVSLIEASSKVLLDGLNLPPEATQRLQTVTPEDPWSRLKLTMAIVRRGLKIAKLERDGLVKVDVPLPATTVLLGACL